MVEAHHTPNKRFQDMETKIFVGGLSWQTTEEDLKSHFMQYGTIKYANIVFDHQTNRSRGYGFVVFETTEAAQLAIQNPNPVIKDKKANCNMAADRAKRHDHNNNGGNYRNNYKGHRHNSSNNNGMNSMNGNYMGNMSYPMGYVGMPYVPMNYVQDPMMMMGNRMDSSGAYPQVQYQTGGMGGATNSSSGANGKQNMNVNMMRPGGFYSNYNNGYNMGGASGNAASSPNRMGGNAGGYMGAGGVQGAGVDQQYGGSLEEYNKQVDFYGGEQGGMEGSQWMR